MVQSKKEKTSNYILRSLHMDQEGKVYKAGDVIKLSTQQLPRFINKVVRASLLEKGDEDILVNLSMPDELLEVNADLAPDKATIT